MTSLISSSALQLDIQNFQSKVDLNKEKDQENISQYTYRYRILKTVLLIFAWITFGANNEIIGSTYEDLRISLGLDYKGISTALVIKSVGSFIMLLFSGVLYDKLSNYADLLMAISGFFLLLRKKFNYSIFFDLFMHIISSYEQLTS